jgi:internalin A
MATKDSPRDFTKDPMVQAYFAKLREWHGYVRFLGLPHLKDNPNLRIERLFVQPRLSERPIDAAAPLDEWPDTVSVMEAMAKHPYLVVLGDPGGGKSTLVSWLAWRFSNPGDHAWTRRFGRLVPLTLILRDMDLSRIDGWRALLDAGLAQTVAKPLDSDEGRALIHDAAASGQALFLLDGLDEVADIETRKRIRAAARDCRALYPESRVIATSRVVGYDEVRFDTRDWAKVAGRAGKVAARLAVNALIGSTPGVAGIDDLARNVLGRPARTEEDEAAIADLALGATEDEAAPADVLYVAPFDDGQVEAFSENWHLERESLREEAEKHAAAFVEAVREHPSVSSLARNPNLLTMMALIHRQVAPVCRTAASNSTTASPRPIWKASTPRESWASPTIPTAESGNGSPASASKCNAAGRARRPSVAKNGSGARTKRRKSSRRART